MTMLTTTLKGLRSHKLRLLTTTLAVMLGVAFMAGTLVLTDTLGARFDEMSADVRAGTDVYVRSDTAISTMMGSTRDRVDASLVETLDGTEGVAAVAGRTSGWAQLVAADGEPIGDGLIAAPQGMNWLTVDELNAFTLVAGHAPAADHEVVIDRGSAEAGSISVGDTATVLTQAGPTEVTVAGIATVGGADSLLGSTTVLFTDRAAQALVGEPGRYDGIALVAADGVDQETLAASAAALLPAGVEAITGVELLAEDQAAAADGLAFFNAFLLTFAVVALGVGGFIIVNTFSIIVAQRSKELAMLRAIGATRRQVMVSVLTESVVVGVLASVAGLVLGVGVAQLLTSLLAAFGVELPPGSLVIEPRSMVTALIVGLLITVLSAVMPARRAARIPPVAAMRDVAIDTSAGSRIRIAAGTAVTLLGASGLTAGLGGVSEEPVALVGLGATLVFLGVAVLGPVIARSASQLIGWPASRLLGVTGEIARENAARSPKRTAATASALMIGVALVGFVTILAASVKHAIAIGVEDGVAAELVVNSDSLGAGGFAPSLVSDLTALPEVAAASGFRMVPALVDGQASLLGGISTDVAGELFTVPMVAGSIDGLGAGGVALTLAKAEELEVQVGDTLPLTFADGLTDDLVVRGVFDSADFADFLVDVSLVDRHAASSLEVQVFVALADGVSLAEGRDAVEAATAAIPNAVVQDLGEYIQWQGGMLDQLLGLMYVLLALAVVIAVLGIVNTLALAILERTRELGLLRALGMTRRQLRSTVRGESVIIALLGTALGLIIGTGFGWSVVTALESEGMRGVAMPGVQLTVIAVLAGLAGVVAALLPARRAARIDVLVALQTT
jgi:putative ABC transport system permease protein